MRPAPRRRRRPAQLCRTAAAAALLLTLAAVSAGAAGRPIRFTSISIEEGLSQSTVLCILNDSRGFMWFGTEDGLNRFDGYDFTHYTHDPSAADTIAHDYVVTMVEGPEGDLWIGTDGGGISRWQHSRDRFVHYQAGGGGEDGLASNLIRALAIDQDGGLWIGTRGAGLDRFDPASGSWHHWRHHPSDSASLSSDNVYALWVDPAGNVWIGTDGGLDRLDPATGEIGHFRHDPAEPASLADDRVRALFADHNGHLWVGTYAGGLARFDQSTGEFDAYRHDPSNPTSLANDRVRSVFEDRDGRLWVGTVAGLNLLNADGTGFARYRHDAGDPYSLAGDDVYCLHQDRGGVLWIGTQAGGVSRWNPATWSFGHVTRSPADPHGLSESNVTSFSEDRAGRLWIGTFGGGLNVMDRATGRVERFLHDQDRGPTLSSDRVMTLLHDDGGVAWIGTLNGGLNRYDPRTGALTVFRHDPNDSRSIGADGIMSLFEDRQGTLWVGTFGGGLSRFDARSRSFTRVASDASDSSALTSLRVTCIAQASTGELWIGTDGGGLGLLDPATGSVRTYRHDPNDSSSLSANTVFSLHVDSSGRLWVGTRGGGLDLLAGQVDSVDEAVFRNFSERDGLSSDVVYGILEDSSGSLWLSTNRGLSRFNPKTESFSNYGRQHGLQDDEFNFGAHFRSAGGELFFGGVNGFNAFYPGRLEGSSRAPDVVLTAFLEFNRPVLDSGPVYGLDRVELGYRDDVVTFEFAALDYTAPQKNRYAYMLEGFDTDWIDLGPVRRVTFTDLDGGDYVLRVRAANSDGVWNEDALALRMTVRPPLWQTWWAYLLYALMIAGALVGYWQVQNRKLRREEEYSHRLENEVSDRTQELADRNLELEELNTQLMEASLTDSLTGLRNRRFLFEQVAKDIALVRRRYNELAMGIERETVFDLVFVMVDLDNFKEINDTFGHPAGDKVLIQMREVLLEACRKSDIVIRWGGDEFLIVGRDTDPDRAEALAERIRTDIEDRIFTLDEGRVLRTTASIGFSCFPFVRSEPDLLPWEQVLAIADAALFIAKKLTRNASVGFFSNSETGDVSDLMRVMREEPLQLVSDGRIDIRTSIPSSEWRDAEREYA